MDWIIMPQSNAKYKKACNKLFSANQVENYFSILKF